MLFLHQAATPPVPPHCLPFPPRWPRPLSGRTTSTHKSSLPKRSTPHLERHPAPGTPHHARAPSLSFPSSRPRCPRRITAAAPVRRGHRRSPPVTEPQHLASTCTVAFRLLTYARTSASCWPASLGSAAVRHTTAAPLLFLLYRGRAWPPCLPACACRRATPFVGARGRSQHATAVTARHHRARLTVPPPPPCACPLAAHEHAMAGWCSSPDDALFSN